MSTCFVLLSHKNIRLKITMIGKNKVISAIVVPLGPLAYSIVLFCFVSFCFWPEAFSYQKSWQEVTYCDTVLSSQARSESLLHAKKFGAQ